MKPPSIKNDLVFMQEHDGKVYVRERLIKSERSRFRFNYRWQVIEDTINGQRTTKPTHVPFAIRWAAWHFITTGKKG